MQETVVYHDTLLMEDYWLTHPKDSLTMACSDSCQTVYTPPWVQPHTIIYQHGVELPTVIIGVVIGCFIFKILIESFINKFIKNVKEKYKFEKGEYINDHE